MLVMPFTSGSGANAPSSSPATLAERPRERRARPPTPRRLTRAVRWYRAASYLGVLATAALLATLVLAPDLGLAILWGVLIPLVPMVLFVAPALWRNLCPIAAIHQLPRRFGFSLGLRAPTLMVRYGYVVAFVLLFAMVGARRFLFDSNGPVLALVIGAVLVLAFTQGLLFRGKSGWCNGICPVGPVGQLYGRGAYADLPNAHCTSCLGCTRNCFDGNPRDSALADLYAGDEQRQRTRRFFAAAFPGFVYAFFTVASPPQISILAMYAAFAGVMAISIAVYMTLEALTGLSLGLLTSLFAVAALNIYYAFSAPELPLTIAGLLAAGPPPVWSTWLVWGFQGLLGVLSVIWLWRMARRDGAYRASHRPGAARA